MEDVANESSHGFPDELVQRSSIPEELLRPRREEAPRYPVDTVIGPLGQGNAPREAYETARRAAAALLDGTVTAPVLSTVNRTFLEDCMGALDRISPRLFRLGGGREEPDGSVSFLVRFAGREEGITGEIFVRLEERRPAAPPPATEAVAEIAGEGNVPEPAGGQTAESAAAENSHGSPPEPIVEPAIAELAPQPETAVHEVPAAQVVNPVEWVWIFEDLVLEEARSREEENRDSRQRFDLSTYERFF